MKEKDKKTEELDLETTRRTYAWTTAGDKEGKDASSAAKTFLWTVKM